MPISLPYEIVASCASIPSLCFRSEQNSSSELMDEDDDSSQPTTDLSTMSDNDDDSEDSEDERGEDDDASEGEEEDDNADADDNTDQIVATSQNDDLSYSCLLEDSKGLLSSDDESEDEFESSTPKAVDLLIFCKTLCRCRKLINHINKSSVLYDALHTLRSTSVTVNLVTDMKVRWGSTNTMVERLLQYRSAINKLFEQLPTVAGTTKTQQATLQRLKLSRDEWSLLEILRNILQVFVEATEMLSGSKYPSLAIAHDVLSSLYFYLSSSSTDPVEISIKNALKQSFDKYIDRSASSFELQDMMVRNPVSRTLDSST